MSSKHKHFATMAALAAAACAWSATSVLAAPAGYTSQVFQFDPAPPSPDVPPYTAGISLNNLGEFVGVHGQATITGYRYTSAGDESLASIYGLNGAIATRIFDDRSIVGLSQSDIFGVTSAFIGHADGTYTLLENLSSDPRFGASAADMNSSGMVVGSASTAPPSMFGAPVVAAAWVNGSIQSLGTLGGESSWATGVNSSGVVIGGSNTAPFQPNLAFRWTAETGMEALALPDGYTHSSATGILDDGTIVGDVAGGLSRSAAIWSPDGTVTVLPWVIGGEGELQIAEVFGNNAVGDLVGQEQHPDQGLHAVLWQDGQGYLLADYAIDLPDHIQLSRATAINDEGQILIDAFDTLNLEFVTVLLTPVPAPGAWAALGVCGVAACARRRR